MRALSAFKWPIAAFVVIAAGEFWLIASLLPGPAISLVVPGDNVFNIPKAGRYTLWSQVESSFQGKLMTFPTGLPSGVSISVTRQDGSIVPLRSEWPTTHHESAAGAIRVAIGTITFDSPGSYRMNTEGLREKRGLYLDQFDMRYFFQNAFLAMLLPFAFLACVAWGILIFVRHRKNPA